MQLIRTELLRDGTRELEPVSAQPEQQPLLILMLVRIMHILNQHKDILTALPVIPVT
jgi:hypothetical protein